MANVKDATVFVLGTVVSVDAIPGRDGKPSDGYKVTIITEGGGFSVVKVTHDDLSDKPDRARLLPELPALFGQIFWAVRNAAYSIDTNSGMATRFLRVVSEGDLDQFVSFANNVLQPASSSK